MPGAATRLVESDAVGRASFGDAPEEELNEVRLVHRLWSFQTELYDAIRRDFEIYTKGLYIYERPGVDIRDGAILSNGEQIYIGAGSVVRAGAVLNAHNGPIYIGEDAEIEELAVVKGPAFIGSQSVIMTGADIKGSSFGFWSKVGGQVVDSIIHSLSNKAHAGYLGNAYVGRWCNFGADTNASNVKNDYGEVRMYDSVAGDLEGSGRQFLGLVMGDHSKSGINTMFTTGTVVGVSCNVYGGDFQPRFIPSFSWGGPDEFTEYRMEKAVRVAEAVMLRRHRELSDAERENLAAVYEATREEKAHR
jgi:UDP-N-acetylglucosamine diphosphorylase/glucosamine-1-phosphate N-acetyltransferase